MVLVIIASLFISFKRLNGVILPLLTVVISSIWTMGLITLLKIPLNLISTVIPVLMVAVGSAYGIHIVSHYHDRLAELEKAPGREEHSGIISSVMKRVGAPVLLAGLTTIAGFSSLGLTEIVPIRTFGLFSSFGVLTAIIVSLTLIPSILTLTGPLMPRRSSVNGEKDRISRALLKFKCQS